MNYNGKRINLSIFGESHGAVIGCSVEGLPAGFLLDTEKIRDMLDRRRASGRFSTKRREKDEFEIVSGVYNGRTDGAPLCALFKNSDTVSADYLKLGGKARPSHADYAAFVKYGGYNDFRGGGQFSARLTLPMVFAGAVAKQMLDAKGVDVGAHVLEIGGVCDKRFDAARVDAGTLRSLDSRFPLLDGSAEAAMTKRLEEAAAEGDSLGGMVECAATGVPAGLGECGFGSVEGVLSQLLFAIPAVKSAEFGAGSEFASLTGSKANDEWRMVNGAPFTLTNNAGGINGGITNGMPLIVRAAIRPIPSIAKPQRTIDLHTMTETELSVEGRHDVCALPRVVVAVEAMVCVGILDLML